MQVFVLAKSPQEAKTRLAPVLDRNERADLAAAMLRDVLAVLVTTCPHGPVTVISSDPHIGSIANAFGAEFHRELSPSGLNGAARCALEIARRSAQGPALILPADLPLLRPQDIADLSLLSAKGGVVAARSVDGGTNALVVPTHLDWPFAYGVDSFHHHRIAALSLGQSFSALTRTSLACDLDNPAMLHRMRHTNLLSQCGAHTRAAITPSDHLVAVRSYA